MGGRLAVGKQPRFLEYQGAGANGSQKFRLLRLLPDPSKRRIIIGKNQVRIFRAGHEQRIQHRGVFNCMTGQHLQAAAASNAPPVLRQWSGPGLF